MLELFFRIFGWLLYAIDVITDVLTGFGYLNGAKIDQSRFGKENFTDYTIETCQDFENYSHPIWGSIALGLTWAPAIACIPVVLEVLAQKKKNNRRLVNVRRKTEEGYWNLTFLLIFLLFLLWPVLGIMM